MLKSVGGRLVPFQVKRFPSLPIRSRRVGLRTIPSIGGKVLCRVDIVVQVDSTPNASHVVTIGGVNYHNGDTTILEPRDYSLTWASGNGGYFSSWGVSGKLSVANPSSESTTLTVTCGGTLTLNLTACPSGEQITNGGFEDGWNGWDHNPFMVLDPVNPHSGIYSAKCLGAGHYVEQDNINVLVGCVESLGYWDRNALGSLINTTHVRVTFTDLTTSETFKDSEITWGYHDVKHLLDGQEGKTIKKFRLYCQNDINLWFDDVSLIGTG